MERPTVACEADLDYKHQQVTWFGQRPEWTDSGADVDGRVVRDA